MAGAGMAGVLWVWMMEGFDAGLSEAILLDGGEDVVKARETPSLRCRMGVDTGLSSSLFLCLARCGSLVDLEDKGCGCCLIG
jgi:hypothetical protein